MQIHDLSTVNKIIWIWGIVSIPVMIVVYFLMRAFFIPTTYEQEEENPEYNHYFKN